MSFFEESVEHFLNPEILRDDCLQDPVYSVLVNALADPEHCEALVFRLPAVYQRNYLKNEYVLKNDCLAVWDEC